MERGPLAPAATKLNFAPKLRGAERRAVHTLPVLSLFKWLVQKIILSDASPMLKRKLEALSQGDSWATARFSKF